MGTLNASKQTEQQRVASVETTSPSASQKSVLTPQSDADDQLDQIKLSETSGRMTLENAETKYVHSSHWTAILDGVSIFLSWTIKRAC